MSNFLDARRIDWVETVSERVVRAGETNVGGWDGYNARIAVDYDVNTVLTIDDDFERFGAFDTEVILSPDEFETLDAF